MTQTCSVSGSLKDIIGNSSPDQIVEFYNLDAPYLSGPVSFGPAPARTVSDPNGNFVIQLIPGHYRMAVDGIPRLMFTVPGDALSLVISSTTPGITSVFVGEVTWGGVTSDVINPPPSPTQPWLGLPGDYSQWQWIVSTQTWVQTIAPPPLA